MLTKQPISPHLEKIRELVGQGLYGAEIARRIGMSRERVRQLANKHKIVLPHQPHIYVTCSHCRMDWLPHTRKDVWAREQALKASLCMTCYRKTELISVICFVCLKVGWLSRADYVHRIFQPYVKILDGKVYDRRISPWFCSKCCQGKYTGTYYGFISHPENTGRYWPPYQMPEEQLCKRCSVVKKANEFSLNSNKHLQSLCKKCCNKANYIRRTLEVKRISMEEYDLLRTRGKESKWLCQHHL